MCATCGLKRSVSECVDGSDPRAESVSGKHKVAVADLCIKAGGPHFHQNYFFKFARTGVPCGNFCQSLMCDVPFYILLCLSQLSLSWSGLILRDGPHATFFSHLYTERAAFLLSQTAPPYISQGLITLAKTLRRERLALALISCSGSTISPPQSFRPAIYIKDNVDESLFGSLETARAKTRSINKAIAQPAVARYHTASSFQSG